MINPSEYANERELEDYLKGINSTLKRINNLSYRLKYVDKDTYAKYRKLFSDLQTKRNQARSLLKTLRLENVTLKAQEYLKNNIPGV